MDNSDQILCERKAQEERLMKERLLQERQRLQGQQRLLQFVNESDHEFVDISSEKCRTYNFGQKGFVKIVAPLKLAVSASGGHRIFSADGTSHYIPSGWVHLSWTVNEGHPNFVK